MNIHIFCIIICKFCYEKKSCLVILLLIDKCLKIGFYCTIISFILIIYLKMESGREILLNIKEVS